MLGISLIWMPPHTTRPPALTARSASGTSAPSEAKMIAASSSTGGIASDGPAQVAFRLRANSWATVSPGRVNAYSSRPWERATWIRMCAAAPNPYNPMR
jgi:hypothetical protein